MELDYEGHPILSECVLYTKELRNNPSVCMVCLMDEYEKHQTYWAKVQLKCGHIAHTRCFRKWCYTKEKVVCPICRKNMDDSQLYCHICNNYGHSAFFERLSDSKRVKKRK